MAILKQTWVSGNLYVTESGAYVSASEFRGPLEGTASWAVTASHALNANTASYIDPNADINLNNLHVGGNAIVEGDLQVNGDLTYVGATDLRVKDKYIEINSTEDGAAVLASADGAGIVIRGAGTPEASILYSEDGDKFVINKTIEGTITNASEAVHAVSALRADSAAEADKVKFALSFGAGISKSVASYDGHEAVVIDVNTTEMEKVVVNNSLQAVSASIADQVSKDFTFGVTASDGTATGDVYNGSVAKNFQVDLSDLETKTHASASVADLQAQINAISGESGSGIISDRIQEEIKKLDADASANASGTAVSGGVFVLSGVAINEADGKLTSGSATSVEVEKAGEAAKAKAELLGAAGDATSSMTLYGVKNYVDAKTGDGVQALSSSVATDIANVMASQSAASQSISQSIADVASNALNSVESSSYIAVSEKANNKQTISAKTHTVADADVTSGDGLALASDVKSYVDNKTSNAVSAEGDDWVAASAADNKVTITTNVKSIADATVADDGLAKASDVKAHVSSSVAALSSSVATKDAAQDAKISALETASGSAIERLNTIEAATASYALKADVDASESADRARLDALEAASASAITRLDALETASATHVTSASLATIVENQAKVDATQSARLDTLESASAVLDNKYVKKAGDSMSGNLNMQTNAIIFGDMKIIWNASEQAIEFVANE